MEAVVYLIRSPLDAISPCLYSAADDAIVIGLEKSFLGGTVLKSATSCSWENGSMLSYKELLELVLKSRRVITL